MIQVFGCKSSCNSFFSEKLLQRSSSFMSLRETFGCLVITPRDLRLAGSICQFRVRGTWKKRISWEFLSKWILRKFFGRFSPSCCQLNRLLFSIELHRVGRLFLREQNFFNKTLRALCSLSFKQTRSSSWLWSCIVSLRELLSLTSLLNDTRLQNGNPRRGFIGSVSLSRSPVMRFQTIFWCYSHVENFDPLRCCFF